jgi:hypothetical protein
MGERTGATHHEHLARFGRVRVAQFAGLDLSKKKKCAGVGTRVWRGRGNAAPQEESERSVHVDTAAHCEF